MLRLARTQAYVAFKRCSLSKKLVRYNSSKNSADPTKSDELFYVSLNDKDADTRNFFKYTWGRWLMNDQQERAKRETKFDWKGMVDVIKEKVDYFNSAPANAELEVKTIMPIHEGKHHKIYLINMSDTRSYVLRIPYSIGHEEYRKERMKSEVATMDFLKRKVDMTIPSVISWSPTKHNRLNSEYMITDYVKGDLLMKSWFPGSHDVKAKSGAIQPVVDFMTQITKTKFNKYGSLYFVDDVSKELQRDLPYEGETNPELVDRWRIGPTAESKFWKGLSPQTGSLFRGPWTSFEDYLKDTINIQMAYIEELEQAGLGNKETLTKALESFQNYAKVVPELFKPEEDGIDRELLSPRLHHPDLNPLNVIHRTDPVKSYLLDFEGSAIRPFILHGVPAFVKNKGPMIFKQDEIPNYNELSEKEKMSVDHFIAQTQNQFSFEYLFRQTESPLFNAFHPHLRRRQQVIETALDVSVDSRGYLDLDHELIRLSQEWQFLSQRPFPIEYNQEDIEKIMEQMDSWNRELLQNPFLETKGWVPANTFEKLLDRGYIVPEGNGNYKLKASE